MKFGKKELKDMILKELNDMVSSQDDPAKVTNDFETFAFTSHINAILGNIKQMEKVIREDEGLDRKTLISFKEKELEDLHMAISFVGDAIDARLKEQNANI